MAYNFSFGKGKKVKKFSGELLENFFIFRHIFSLIIIVLYRILYMRITEQKLRRIIRSVISESIIADDVIDDITDLAVNGEVPGKHSEKFGDYPGEALSDSELHSEGSLRMFVAVYCLTRGIDITSDDLPEIVEKVRKKIMRKTIELGDELAMKHFFNRDN